MEQVLQAFRHSIMLDLCGRRGVTFADRVLSAMLSITDDKDFAVEDGVTDALWNF